MRQRLARGDLTGQATGAVGSLLANLSQLAEDLSTCDRDPDAVASMLQLLAALTGTLERLARAGVNLDATGSQLDDSGVRALALESFARGLRAGIGRKPTILKRWAARCDRWALVASQSQLDKATG